MDDIQTILYIAIGVIYLVARALKRRKSQIPPPVPGDQVQEVEEATERTPQRKRPLSFGDLIKEVRGQVSRPEPKAEAEPEPERHRQPLVSDPETQETYQKSIKEAKRLKKKTRKIESKMSSLRLLREQDAEEETSIYMAKEIADSLKNNWDIKKAMVINEILTRKYN